MIPPCRYFFVRMLDSKKEVICQQTHNCLLTGYGAPRAPSPSRDPIPGLLRDWVQIFETPTVRWVIGKLRKYLWGQISRCYPISVYCKKSLNKRPIYLTWNTGGEPNFSVPICNMGLASKDDMGVKYSVALQQSHRIIEGQLCG